jgi:hypothetical protein
MSARRRTPIPDFLENAQNPCLTERPDLKYLKRAQNLCAIPIT